MNGVHRNDQNKDQIAEIVEVEVHTPTGTFSMKFFLIF